MQTVDVEPYNALIKIMILVTNILIEVQISLCCSLDVINWFQLPQSLLLQQFASYYCAILSLGFKYTVVPLHGLVILCSSWYRLLESHSLNFTSLVCSKHWLCKAVTLLICTGQYNMYIEQWTCSSFEDEGSKCAGQLYNSGQGMSFSL